MAIRPGPVSPGKPGIQGRMGSIAHPTESRARPQAPVAVASSTATPGPMVDEIETFFR